MGRGFAGFGCHKDHELGNEGESAKTSMLPSPSCPTAVHAREAPLMTILNGSLLTFPACWPISYSNKCCFQIKCLVFEVGFIDHIPA